MRQSKITYIARAQLTKVIKGHTIKVDANIEHIGSNRMPHFSITGEIYRVENPEKCRESNMTHCDCIHEEIERYFPELTPIIALHLSDSNGMPMHCIANACYWAGLTKYEKPKADVLASHLRISESKARRLINAAHRKLNNFPVDMPLSQVALGEKVIADFCKKQFPRYEKEAKAGKELIEKLAAKEIN